VIFLYRERKGSKRKEVFIYHHRKEKKEKKIGKKRGGKKG